MIISITNHIYIYIYAGVVEQYGSEQQQLVVRSSYLMQNDGGYSDNIHEWGLMSMYNTTDACTPKSGVTFFSDQSSSEGDI